MATDESADSKQQLGNSKEGLKLRQAVVTHVVASRLVLLLILFVMLWLAGDATQAQQCPDPVPQTSGSHSFRQQGESFEIPITLADCQPVALELRWAYNPRCCHS